MRVGWHRIIWQMVRHACGPRRAWEREIAWRYHEACGYHLPPAERAAMLREASKGAPIIYHHRDEWPRKKVARRRRPSWADE